MTLSIDPVVARNGNDHEEYSYLTMPSQRCHVLPINEYSGLNIQVQVLHAGLGNEVSIQVWVFMFRFRILVRY